MWIPKMCLKQSFSYYKWVLPAILSLTVLSKYISVSSNFDTAILLDCTESRSVLSGYWIGNLMRIQKMCLIQTFCHYKGVLQAILSFQTVFLAVQTLTLLFSLIVPNFVVFFQAIK